MLDSIPLWVTYPSFLFVITAAAGVAYQARQRQLAIKQNLRDAESALDAFLAAYAKLKGEPALPDAAKQSLEALASVIPERGFAHHIVGTLEAHWIKDGFTPEGRALQDQMNQLLHSRPDIVQTFGEAIITGVMSAVLRWPETSIAFKRTAMRLVINQPKEVAAASIAAKAVQHSIVPPNRNIGGNGVAGGAHAMAY